MKYFIGIDDTDNHESPGTGHLARWLAQIFTSDFHLLGVTRHQLLEDPRIPKTAKNSCAGILLEGDLMPIEEIILVAKKIISDNYHPGSDPGLCVAASRVPKDIIDFGMRVKTQVVDQREARALAAVHGLYLEGLGGDQGGVIGALAAVGLLAEENDGRYVMVGDIRSLEGFQPVTAVIAAGVAEVLTTDGRQVEYGSIMTDKMRPARRYGKPILYVSPDDDCWIPLKFD